MQGFLAAASDDGEIPPETSTYEWHEYAERKAIMPSEDANYTIDLGAFPSFGQILNTRKNVVFQGRIDYQSGGRNFRSTFQVVIRLDSLGSDVVQEVPLFWHNEELV
ncbi:MAG: hypothetical protein IH963_13385 [Chloroflexi bacterium]|nr:hypothetical protein [Chloroflexota bacterium]